MIPEASLRMLERQIEAVKREHRRGHDATDLRDKLATTVMCLLPDLIAEARKLRAVRKALGVSS